MGVFGSASVIRRPGAADRGVAVRHLLHILCVAIYIVICAVTTLAATATMTGHAGKGIRENINHSDIRFTAIVSLR
jgi:hypothetical protein